MIQQYFILDTISITVAPSIVSSWIAGVTCAGRLLGG